MNIVSIVGARPQFIKLAALVRAIDHHNVRNGSPPFGFSSFTTSAPISANSIPVSGPVIIVVASTTLIPSRGDMHSAFLYPTDD